MDQLFAAFIKWLMLILILFGAGMTCVLIWGDHVLGLRMVNVFATMFSAVIGLGSGYLLGSRTTNGNGKNGGK